MYTMKIHRQLHLLTIILSFSVAAVAAPLQLQTQYAAIKIDNKGFITSIVAKSSGREYSPTGHPSPVLSLHENNTPNDKLIPPASALFVPSKGEITLTFANQSVAVIKALAKETYFRFQLVSLEPRGSVDNVVWGPLNTTISKIIGDIIGVVRDDTFAIGHFGLDDNTIAGPVTDGDCYTMGYYIHSPDPVRYPVPGKYREGQWFNIGGDGVCDTAFYSHPEEYFQQFFGNGAKLQPAFGSTIAYHARDRRRSYTHLFSLLPGFPRSRPRYMTSDPLLGVDFIGSAIALYACPDDRGLATLKEIFKSEGLIYVTDRDGRWIRDPAAARPTLYWNGPVDKAIEYAKAMGFKDISRDTGEFYSNRPSDWVGHVTLGGKKITYKEFAEMCHKEGLTHGGLHTLCMFLQGGICRDVTPIPSTNLQTVCRTTLAKDISETDTEIIVTDPTFLGEKGTWPRGDDSNYIQVGGEMMRYEGISDVAPWTLKGVKRGHASKAFPHKAGDELVKLQQNCYNGFVPDMKLLLEYADDYVEIMIRNGMDAINFDGYECLMYQNHGYYAMKIFNRRLFEGYHAKTGKWPRVTGSNVFAGAWEFMNVCDLGGGNNMYIPSQGRRNIEGKDVGNGFAASWFPGTFGIQGWIKNLPEAENMMAKAIGWDSTFALSVSQDEIDKTPDKEAIFKAFNAWQEAREKQLFSKAMKEKMRDPDLRFQIERGPAGSFVLYTVTRAKDASGNEVWIKGTGETLAAVSHAVMTGTAADDVPVGNEALRLVDSHVIHFSSPARRVPSNKMVDGPLLGNGDLGVVVAGNPEALRFHIGKNDFWGVKTQSPQTVGRIELLTSVLTAATYKATCDLRHARWVGEFAKAGTALGVSTFVDANAGRLFLTLENKGTKPLETIVHLVKGEGERVPGKVGENGVQACVGGTNNALSFLHTPDGKKGRHVAMAIRILGVTGNMVTLAPGEKCTLVASILSDLDVNDPLWEATTHVASMTSEKTVLATHSHEAWWNAFWRKSFIEIPDKTIEQHWYAAQYIMASCSRAGKVAPGLWGNWITMDRTAWHGDFHLNYNFQAPFYSVCSANHSELMLPFHDAMNQFIPRGRKNAEKHGMNGIFLPVSIGPWGMCPEGDDSHWGQKSNAAYAALNFIDYWRMTKDTAWLAKTGYPFLREVEQFWTAELKLEGDRYVIEHDAIHEGSGGAGRSGISSDFNPILSLGLVRTLYTSILETSEALGVDADLRPKWKDILTRLSAFPTQVRNGKTIFRYTERGTPWWKDNTLGIQHIYPAGAIGLGSDPKLLEIARNMLEAMSRWQDNNGASSWYAACARTSYEPERTLTEMRTMYDRHSLPNRIPNFGGGGIENVSPTAAVTEMLIQSYDGVIRFFPAWPRTFDARFGTLRARGAFLVSATLKDRVISGVKIFSERGRNCVVENPWPGKRVQVIRGERGTETVEGDRFVLKTSPGESISLDCCTCIALTTQASASDN